MSGRHDFVIRGATLYDGSGGAPFAGDLAIAGDRIAALGDVAADGLVELDGEGLAVAPGFVDVHTHDDFAAILYPDMAFKLEGGVTTCVVGNCGMGCAPHRQAVLMARAFHPGRTLPAWEGHAGYLARLDASPPGVNVAALAGHGTLRLAALDDPRGEPSGAEMARMKSLLHEGLEAGVLGLSTGLIYEPGRHARTDEIVELAREMAGTGALYTTHMRDEGAGLVRAVDEAIEIGERAGVPVQISHHKASGRESWGRVAESLARIEGAQARGLDVHADQYPYTAGSTILAAIVQNRGFEPRGEGGIGAVEGRDVVIASTAGHPQWEGRSVADFAAEWGVPDHEAADRILEAEPLATIVMHSMSEDDVRTVMRHPSTMIGSDGIPSLDGKPHPRLFGTFARVLGHYARDEGVLSLEEAVRRMTSFPATKFGLHDRGVLREGAHADLVVFDPARILDAGTYEDPCHPPTGIHHVFVNGHHAVQNGTHTHARAGRALRRSPPTP